jgi:hypothetical protein
VFDSLGKPNLDRLSVDTLVSFDPLSRTDDVSIQLEPFRAADRSGPNPASALVPIPDPSDYRPLTVDNRLAELRTGAQSSTEVESA